MAKVVKLKDSKGEERYPITTGQAVKLKGGKNLDTAMGEKADKKSVLTKNEVYTKDQTYSKLEVFSKNETYSRQSVYRKDEVYNKTEVYPISESYNRFAVQSLIVPINVGVITDRDFTHEASNEKTAMICHIASKDVINMSYRNNIAGDEDIRQSNFVFFVNTHYADCAISLPQGCIAESPTLLVPAGKIVMVICQEFGFSNILGSVGAKLVIRAYPPMTVI